MHTSLRHSIEFILMLPLRLRSTNNSDFPRKLFYTAPFVLSSDIGLYQCTTDRVCIIMLTRFLPSFTVVNTDDFAISPDLHLSGNSFSMGYKIHMLQLSK
jgi:hypothetical protein